MAEHPSYVPEFDPVLHEYRWKGRILPSITTVLQAAGLYNLPPVEQDVLNLAAERSRRVHWITVRMDRGLPGAEPSAAVRGYLDAYHNFCDAHVFTPHDSFTECPLCDPQLEIAGTPDRAGYLNGGGAVLDLKTFPQREAVTGIQLAGYRHLLRVNGFQAPRRVSVHLQPNGRFQVEEYRDFGDEAAFLAALNLYRWRMRNLRKEHDARVS